jgi:acyl-homoserine-lactone acylase
MQHPTCKPSLIALVCSGTLLLSACNGDPIEALPPTTPPSPPVVTPAPSLPAFDSDGVLEANIRWTEYGVPHITADNVESMSYGVGYAFARDNLCLLADQIVKFNSERAKYFGPDMEPGSGDAQHLINDFGYLTVGIKALAQENLASLSPNTRAMLSGYTQGYNKYLSDTGVANIDPSCANQPWVQPISPQDLLTYALGIALLPGAANFLPGMFAAAPPGESFLPTVVGAPKAAKGESSQPFAIKPEVTVPEINAKDLGSNGWGLGSEMTENGMGMVLGNPHFPHTGNLRFWQFHTTIPGFLNVMGGSLMGVPGAVNIGFNENMAWTHTFSTAEHFVLYQLSLDSADPRGLTHTVDGQPRTIFSKPLEIDVATGPNSSIRMTKTAYYTNYGPMVTIPGNFDWNQTNAFAIKDANLPNFDIVDHWFAMNLSRNMEEFKQAFRDYDGVIFNNTMAASKNGEVFYIDDSTVPGLTRTAIDQLTTNPLLVGTRAAADFTVLPGFISQMDFVGPVPYADAPKYEGRDYVQNSNDSFWLTNLANPITGVSPLFGKVNNEQSLRSRMAHKLLAEASGSDGLFSMAEVQEALIGNHSYLADAVLDDLVAACSAQESTPVNVNGVDVDISAGCAALAQFDGRMNLNSTAAHLFREFAFMFRLNPQWEVPFDAADPANTPNTLDTNATTLQQFAQAILNVQAASINLDATLGEVQFVERSTPMGTATGVKLPWGGAHNVEGGFNVFDTDVGNNGTLLPRHEYSTLPNTRLSVDGQGYHTTYGSSWMMVVGFTEAGPQANGILTYSQSHNPTADNYLDQTMLYSSQPQLRPLRFTEADIEANKVMEMNISSASSAN